MVYLFGPFRLDVGAGQLFRGEVPIPLRPKAWAVLSYLVERAGTLVTKDELLEAVWPGVALNEEAAARHVREVREALGDTGRPVRYVQTVHRRGFRFVAPVNGLGDGSTSALHAVAHSSAEGETSPLRSALATLGFPLDGVAPSEAFVGRNLDLASIATALARARSGQPVLIGVSGEPGIGKTRLLSEASRIAAGDGFRVLAACCFEEEGQPPFWPWAQVLRGLTRSEAPQPDGSSPPWARSDLAQLVPELIAAPPAPVGEHDTQQARLRLFDAVLATLRTVTADQPLLLLIDDLHWADPASIALLQTAVGDVEGLPLAVLGTYRVDEGRAAQALKRIVAWLDRGGRFRHVPLRGLAEEETGIQLGALAGGVVDAPLVSAIHGRTDGNPYFTAELWRHLFDNGAVRREGETFSRAAGSRDTVPEGIRATIGLRLERLSEGCLGLLKVASVCGLEFDFDTVRAVAGIDEDPAFAALEEAEAARIVTEAPARPGSYRFNHALARDCLYSDMGGLRRAGLHWAVGEEIERRQGGDAVSRAAELSHHFTNGASRGDAEKALGYALEAARQATAGCGYEVAAGHLERALGVIDGAARSGPAELDGARRRAILLDLAESHERSGNAEGAQLRFEEAASLAREQGDLAHLARAALGMGTRWTMEDGGVIALLEEALEQVGPGAEPLRARLIARLARALYLLPDTRARREALCEQALGIARRLGDLSLLGGVLSDSLDALFHCDNLAEREALAGALYAAATASENATLRLQAHAWRIIGSMSLGRLRDADAELATFSALAHAVKQPRFLGVASAFQAALDLTRGKLVAAEEHACAAARWGERFSADDASAVAYIQIMGIRHEQGRPVDLQNHDRWVRIPGPGDPSGPLFSRPLRFLAPFVMIEQGYVEQARIAFADAVRNLDELPPENARNTRLSSIHGMSEAAAFLGDKQVAQRLFALTEPYADQWVVSGFGINIGISFQTVRGNLLATLGAWDEAAAHFERAIAEHEREQALVPLARTLCCYVHMLALRGRARDRRLARETIDRGLKIAQPAGLVVSAGQLARAREELDRTSSDRRARSATGVR